MRDKKSLTKILLHYTENPSLIDLLGSREEDEREELFSSLSVIHETSEQHAKWHATHGVFLSFHPKVHTPMTQYHTTEPDHPGNGSHYHVRSC